MSSPQESSDLAIEQDFRQVHDPGASTSFLPSSSIEIIREPANRGQYRYVLFDFDGTLSLIREGWPEVMVPMMVEILQETDTDETPEALYGHCMDFVMRLNGKQTLYQMIQLREEVVQRGGQPLEAREYKQRYHERLMRRISSRRDALASGAACPEDHLVPGAIEILESLRARGLECYLASGTDEKYVVEEARLLGVADYFAGRIFGAKGDVREFSKAMVIRRIFEEHDVGGHELLGFGDGYVEIDNLRAVGGTPVAVASDEANRSGKPDPWKRDRLVSIGADLVIPDFQEQGELIEYLML